ncbi:gag-pol polyprotein [Chaetoceros tenuissimus]|uniref:Gag-pol polyprotein n=1 Tax=Chaetoceros tenuissimus TaxID=426638 RepID=A0AAD3HFH8_9STRA|nr:gag-pol polyprotein [Chaetoceros tenuissimus]
MPTPFGAPLQMTILVDADHAHDRLTGRSLTGLIIFVGSTPVYWSTKRQGAVATSTYHAEFAALKEAINIRYYLRCLGVHIPNDGSYPTQVFGDNFSVIQSAANPQHDLTKKHVVLSFHFAGNNPIDVFNNPIDVFNKTSPSKAAIKSKLGLSIIAPPSDADGETEAAKFIREGTNRDTEETIAAIWQAEIKMFVQKTSELRTNMAKLWSIIKDQCSHSLQEELRAEKDFDQKEKDYDVLWLLQTLQQITSGINDTSNCYYSLYHTIKDFYKIRQGKDETLASYFERFETAVNLVTMTGGSVTNFELIHDAEVKINPNVTEDDVLQSFLGIAFLECADSNRYQNLWKELRNDLAKGVDRYPTSLAKANTLLRRWMDTKPSSNPRLRNLQLLQDSGGRVSKSYTNLVENIRACEDGEGIQTYSNSGSTDYNHEADVTLLPAMQTYYNSSGIANVLSFFEVQKLYHVKFDSKVKNEFYVRTDATTWLRFKCLSRGLYYVDMDNLNDHICSESHVLLFSTVKANKEFFSTAEIEGAENARILQQRLHYPSDAVLQEALDKNFITDTKVTGADVERAEAIMGKAASICKGKTVRKRINSKYKIRRFHIPSKLVKNHPTEELDTDFMYVQGAP